MGKKRTRTQLQTDENNRQTWILGRAVAKFLQKSAGFGTMQDVSLALASIGVDGEAKPLKAEPLSINPLAQLSVIDDRGTVMKLADVPDELIRLEYHKRVKVGRKRRPPTYHCQWCDKLMYRDESRLHSRTECARAQAELNSVQQMNSDKSPSLQVIDQTRHLPSTSTRRNGEVFAHLRSVGSAGILAQSQRRLLALPD
jgi:hypothetical protein